MKTRCLCLCLLFWCSVAAFGQPLLHLHSNKQTYLAGEKVWVSAYLTDSLSGQLLTQNHPLYLQLYAANGASKASEVLFTQKGRGFGYLPLPVTAVGGIYRIRAFTKTMFEQKRFYEQRMVVQGTKDSTVAFLNDTILPPQQNTNALKISVLPNKYVFEKRERVDLLVKVQNAEGQPQQGTFSVSVSDLRAANGQENHPLFVAWGAQRQEPLLTEVAETLRYSGQVVNQKTGDALDKVELIVMGMDSTKHFTRVVQTDSSGHFEVNDLVFEGDLAVRYQVNNRREKSIQGALVKWDAFPKADSIPVLSYQQLGLNAVQKEQLLGRVQKPDGEQAVAWESQNTLSEVEVRAKRTPEDEPRVVKLHLNSTYTTRFDETTPAFGDVSQLFSGTQINGIQMLGDGRIKVFGAGFSGTPLILLNGIEVSDLPSINPNEILRVEVLNPPDAAIYGSSGRNGVIALYTGRRRGSSAIQSQTKANVLRGYQKEQLFFNPDYSQPQKANGLDNRLTLYWNPEVLTDAKGEAWLSFYTSDVGSNFKVMVTGITQNGSGTVTKLIRVK